MNKKPPFVWRELHWPRPLDTNRAAMLLRQLASDSHRDVVAFNTVVSEGEFRHLVGTPAHQIRPISHLIESHAPGAKLEKLAGPRPSFKWAAELTVQNGSLGLYVDRVEQATRSMLAAMAEARFRGEEIILHIVLGAGRAPRMTNALADPTQGVIDRLVHGTRRPTSEVTARLRAKAAENGFRAWVGVSAHASSEGRRKTLMNGMLAALRTLQAPGTHLDFRRVKGSALDRISPSGWIHLSSMEALSIASWPIGKDHLPGMPNPHPKQLPWYAKSHETDRVFGTTTAPGKKIPVGLSAADGLYHCVVTGSTGSGKSTVLKNLIAADLWAGRTVVVIDMKSDLARELLELVPPERRDDVVYLDPTSDRPVGFNPLHVPGTAPEVIADGAVQLFRSLFPDAFGPRTSDLFYSGLLTLAHTPGTTLPDLLRLFRDRPYREKLLRQIPEEIGLHDYWAEFEGLSERQQSQHLAPLSSRLRQYLLRPSLKRVMDQSEPAFDLASVLTKPRILVVPLNSGIVGADASRLLGSALVSALWQLTLARASTPPSQRTPVSIYIDEAQEFVRAIGADLGDAIARSRALGVGWTFAFQLREQMPSDVMKAIDGNAMNKIVFAGGPGDSKAHAAMAPELDVNDFAALQPYFAYARLKRNGIDQPWVSLETLPSPAQISDPDELIALSEERWGRRLQQATETSSDGPTSHAATPSAPIGRRRRT